LAAQALRVELAVVTVRGGDYTAAFDDLIRQRVSALVVASHQYFVSDRATIIDLAARHKLPAMYEWREQVADGGLLTYSTSLYGIHQRVVAYVDRILKGAKPAEMPVERPTKFDLVINLKTARALGLAVPQTLLLRADEVIE
jgi:putative ABC transport system substrate-binding protein